MVNVPGIPIVAAVGIHYKKLQLLVSVVAAIIAAIVATIAEAASDHILDSSRVTIRPLSAANDRAVSNAKNNMIGCFRYVIRFLIGSLPMIYMQLYSLGWKRRKYWRRLHEDRSTLFMFSIYSLHDGGA